MGIRGSILNSLQVQDYSSRAQAWGSGVGGSNPLVPTKKNHIKKPLKAILYTCFLCGELVG